MKEPKNFQTIFFKIIVLSLLIFLVLLIFLSFYLNESFFLKFSVDKGLEPATIHNINSLQFLLFIFGLIFLFMSVLLFYFKNRSLQFIEKHKSGLQGILLLLFVIFLFLVFGEIITRILLHGKTADTGNGPGVLEFNQKYVKLNSEYLRDFEYPVEKGKNVIRIAGLGDSSTYGFGIKDVNKTFLKLIETRLNEERFRNKSYEVINFAKPGYGTIDELKVLKEKALKYSPDIIIIGYSLNDFENIDPSIKTKSRNRITLPYIDFILRDVSYLYYFIELRVNSLAINLGYRESYENSLIKYFNSSINRDYNKQSFKEISDVAKQKNIKVIVVILPMIYNLEDYPFISGHKFVEAASRENNFSFIDPLEKFKEYNESELVVNEYDSHPNELGHELVYQAVYKKLINEVISK